VAKPGSITPHTKFKAEVYIFEARRKVAVHAVFTGYSPQFYFARRSDGGCCISGGVEMVMPGDNVANHAELITRFDGEGARFAIREGAARWCRRGR